MRLDIIQPRSRADCFHIMQILNITEDQSIYLHHFNIVTGARLSHIPNPI
jgi:hypothetical protein